MSSIWNVLAIYTFSIVFLLPTVYLTIGVGWAFSRIYSDLVCKKELSHSIYIESLLISCLASTICMTFGAILAFLLSRYIFRGFIRKRLIKLHPDFQNYDYAIQTEGALFVFLMQFSLIPYSLLCYLFGGLTRVSLWHFFIGVLGMAVPNLFWSYLGSLIQNITT